MKKLLFITVLVSIILFSCNENGPNPEEKRLAAQGLFGSGDTVNVNYETGKVILSTPDKQVILIPQANGDTVVITITQEERTGSYTYQVPVIDTTTRKYAPPVVPDPNDPEPGTNYGTLTFSAGYNSSSEINTNQGMYNSISSTQKTEGVASFRSEVRGSQASQSSGYRSEMQYNGLAQNPAEGVWEYDVYYENWKAVSGGGHSVQWHPNSSSGSAVLSLQNYGGRFNVVRSLGGINYHQSSSTQIATVPNRWYKMRWEIKWTTGSDGYIRLYIDGSLYYSFTGKTSDGGQYLKLGQNRWSMSSSQNTIVYYDNLRIYKK